MRGLAIETGRLDVARDILLEWAGTLSEGMLPNQFPGNGDLPDYNSVDAALWYVIAAHDFMEAARAASMADLEDVEPRIRSAIADIVEGYSVGTRRGIQLQADGLLAAGDAGSQLTWMDAKVDGLACTPRVGKPVEIQALWINALHIAAAHDPKWEATLHEAKSSFERRFWNEEHNYLNDVVDVGHQADTVDASFRPNQILAVGGLPFEVLDASKCRSVVDAVEAQLWTPMGLRSLARGERGYCPKYEGDMASRDRAYHQGTVWPWLTGPFVEAWVRVHGDGKAELREARERFVDPLIRRMTDQGIGHLSEIADAEPPYTPRGNPFQAWSLSELIRAVKLVGRGSYTPEPDLDLATTNAAVNC
jgi:predicted glycogen debranching enzyme